MRLILILGDQLTPGLSALRTADPARDRIVMAEVMEEATPVPHHPQKIALVFAAMRKFAAQLAGQGWQVLYTRLDDPGSPGTLPAELIRRAAETGASRVLVTRPGDWRLIQALQDVPLDLTFLPDDRFLCPEADFVAWARGRKDLRMEYFYRDMRRRTGLLMQGDQPIGGRWNFDAENRKPAARDLFRPRPPRFPPDAVTEEVLDLVEARFPHHFGRLRPFEWATDRTGALQALDHFVTQALPRFGAEQDAMLEGQPFLSHALISPYLNLGLLTPLEVCQAAEARYHSGAAPIEAVEGFIRQILGWREFIRGIWALQGPDYTARNALNHHAPLPEAFWGGPTRMACVKSVVAQTRDLAYAHHIQRLMVTGNFALLAGVDPVQVHRWYLAVYIDALEWVEAPNVIGMSQWADGGVVASKPYVSSGAYIDRMSDHCAGCFYDVKAREGDRACPFNPLYWHFLDRHRDRFGKNPRMAAIYAGWDKRSAADRDRVLAQAKRVLARLQDGVIV